jgi:hypothetical protein
MAYAEGNPKTKKLLKDKVKAWKEGNGRPVYAFSPGPYPLKPGRATIEGPHYPEPHRWYANVMLNDQFIITEVK